LPRAHAIIAACRKNRVQLGVIFQMRFGQAARRLKAALESGMLGRLLVADVIDKEYRPPKYYATDAWRGTKELEGGGCLMTQSIHVLDLLQWLAGPAVSVFAKKRTALHDIEVEDLLVATLSFANGAIGVFESSTAAYPAFKSRVEIHGSDGSAIINGEWDETFFWDVKSEAEKLDAMPGFKFADVSEPRLMPEDRHLLEFADMAAAIRSGRAPSVTGEEALRSLAIAMSLYESANTGKEIFVKDILARDGIPAWW
jgi:predicted dehydrogenase